MRLVPIRVVSPVHVEFMRQIFNECIPYLSTKPLKEKSYEEQQQWWAELNRIRKQVKAFVYYEPGNTEQPVAFMMLQWHHGGRITPIFGITESARGKGYAREIIKHYLDEADGPLHGSMLATHAAIIKMNYDLGWQKEYEENGVIYVYHPNEKKQYPDYQGMLDYWGS